MIKKQLFASISPVPGENRSEIELSYGGRDIGALTLHQDDLAEFVEALRAGFTLVIAKANGTPQADNI